MTVVSDTSPIINLARIDKLDILCHSFGGVVIPRAVYEEITRFGPQEPGASEVEHRAWITVYEVANRPLVEALKLEIDPGEAEAIACATELNAERLWISRRLYARVLSAAGEDESE